jgi:Na+-driven multidrug efflux pump
MNSVIDEQVNMTVIEEQQETGLSLMLAGLAVWVVDLLVVFFLPSGIKLGRQGTFLSIIAAMAVVGLSLLIVGYKARGKSGME